MGKSDKAKGREKGKQKGTGEKQRPADSEPKRRGRRGAEVPEPEPEATDVRGALPKLREKLYRKELKRLHGELVKLQEWVRSKGLKVCIVFEGRDGAGKGGAIKALTERVSTRVFRVVALPAPTEREQSQMYAQRYIPHFPAAGEVVIFDRSWYNRAGVERVMGFCTDDQARKFLQGISLVERAMVESGILLLKYWLEVSEEEQTQRLQDRIDDPRKIWKLSPMDLESYGRWYDYSRARDEMFAASDVDFAPWFVVDSNDKKRARLNILAHILKHVPYKDLPASKIELPKRQNAKNYVESEHPLRRVPDITAHLDVADQADA